MRALLLLLFAIFFLHTHIKFSIGVPILDSNLLKNDELDVMVKRACSGKIGECAEDEMMMESESSRRVLLMEKRYISYGTLKRDLVPCGTPGASYYNCNKGEANPYNRGCEMITRCAKDSINT